jgi:hypothetical protein
MNFLGRERYCESYETNIYMELFKDKILSPHVESI